MDLLISTANKLGLCEEAVWQTSHQRIGQLEKDKASGKKAFEQSLFCHLKCDHAEIFEGIEEKQTAWKVLKKKAALEQIGAWFSEKCPELSKAIKDAHEVKGKDKEKLTAWTKTLECLSKPEYTKAFYALREDLTSEQRFAQVITDEKQFLLVRDLLRDTPEKKAVRLALNDVEEAVAQEYKASPSLKKETLVGALKDKVSEYVLSHVEAFARKCEKKLK